MFLCMLYMYVMSNIFRKNLGGGGGQKTFFYKNNSFSFDIALYTISYIYKNKILGNIIK